MMATAKNKLSTDFQSAINCVPERSLLGAFGKQHHDYDHDVFNSAGSTLATPHFGPENGVHLKRSSEVNARLVKKQYPKGIKISDPAMALLNIKKSSSLPKWNYTLRPSKNGK